MVPPRRAAACAFVVCLVAVVVFPASSRGASKAADPGAPGPYAIGHTSFSLLDTSRHADSAFGGRPVPLNVWHPVDASAIASDSPQAIYALDPLYSRWPVSTSADWEQFGMQRA